MWPASLQKEAAYFDLATMGTSRVQGNTASPTGVPSVTFKHSKDSSSAKPFGLTEKVFAPETQRYITKKLSHRLTAPPLAAVVWVAKGNAADVERAPAVATAGAEEGLAITLAARVTEIVEVAGAASRTAEQLVEDLGDPFGPAMRCAAEASKCGTSGCPCWHCILHPTRQVQQPEAGAE